MTDILNGKTREQVIQEWTEALRSGKYKQGRFCLRNERDEFCCLGVLLDVVQPDGWRLRDGEWSHRRGAPLHTSEVPAKTICQAIGLTVPLDWTSAGDDSAAAQLYRQNDKGRPFPEIADEIDRLTTPAGKE